MTTQPSIRVRSGTAERLSGRNTAAKIVRSAYQILLEGGYTDFSMRKIANKADVRLANLQYYFPKMQDLIKALMDHVAEIYEIRYQEKLSRVTNNPLDKIKAAIELNFEDVNTPETRHFFIQFWPFLGVADDYTGKLLVEFYQPQHQQLSTLIKDLMPELGDQEIMLRAEMVTALFEGLLVTSISASKGKKESDTLKQSVVNTCLSIIMAE